MKLLFDSLRYLLLSTGCTAACHWQCPARPQRVLHPTCNIRSSIFWIVCEFASMLLILTLIYLFHGFQSHAVPLTNILEESSINSTAIITPTCICPADQRTIWDILWSCLATIIACSWVSVHPNIPGPNESSRRIFLRRLELMFWAVFGPEMIITWALRQWLGAHHLEKLYKGEPSKSNVSNLSANTKS